MVSIYKFSEPEIIGFALMLLRLSAFVVAWPIFGVDLVPAPVKILLALVLGLCVFPTLQVQWSQFDVSSTNLIWMAVRETFLGVALGFLARMFLMAIQIAGDLISLSIGLSGAQIFNPSMGAQATPLDQLLFALTALIYLSINGHHLFLSAVVDTFRIIPIGPGLLSSHALMGIGDLVQEIISIGIRMSAPVVIAILIVNLVMGVLGKTVPQINVLITSLAVNVMVGLFVLFLAVPLMVNQMPEILETSAAQVFRIMKAF